MSLPKVEWAQYEFSDEEFKKRLGIPANETLVSTFCSALTREVRIATALPVAQSNHDAKCNNPKHEKNCDCQDPYSG